MVNTLRAFCALLSLATVTLAATPLSAIERRVQVGLIPMNICSLGNVW
jgi:hypothetical protein